MVSTVLLCPAGCGEENGAAPTETPAALIERALETLLAHSAPGAPGGFVVFAGPGEAEYVQYSLDEPGLLLNWPTFHERGPETLPLFRGALTYRGFVDRSPADSSTVTREMILSLAPGEMRIGDDGLYAQCGRDAGETTDLTVFLLERVFGISDLGEVAIDLAVDG